MFFPAIGDCKQRDSNLELSHAGNLGFSRQ
jgi:hypothetical protein